MMLASQLSLFAGPTAQEALAEPAVLAAAWMGSGPPWMLVFLVGLALAMLPLSRHQPEGRPRSPQR